jgi:hypothetical protein
MMGNRGKHTKIWVGGYHLTTQIKDIKLNVTADEIEESGYGQDHSTLKGQFNSDITLDGYFNPNTGSTHDALVAIGDTAVLVSTVFGENAAPTLGDIAVNLQAQQTTYEVAPDLADVIAASGAFKAKGIAAEFGVLLADATISANGQQTGVDEGAASANGGVGVLHILALSAGDSITVKIQDSADNVNWADLITFTLDGAAIGAERVEVTGAVDQYVRASYTVTGSGVSFPIAVIFIRK